MKKALFVLVLATLVQAQVKNEKVEGTGYSSGFCQGGSLAHFCTRDLERRSEQEAERDAEHSCRLKQGSLLYYSGSCSAWCRPSFIPNGSNSFVSCSARCRYICEIKP